NNRVAKSRFQFLLDCAAQGTFAPAEACLCITGRGSARRRRWLRVFELACMFDDGPKYCHTVQQEIDELRTQAALLAAGSIRTRSGHYHLECGFVHAQRS